MTNKEELEMWSKMLTRLQSIPDYCRSRNHTEYLKEVEGRVNNCYDIEEYQKQYTGSVNDIMKTDFND